VDLVAAAKEALAGAREGGADAADALAVEARESRFGVRKGEVESARESETRGVGVRAFRGGRTGIATTTDVTPAGLRRAGRMAADLAGAAGEDPAAGLPDPSHRGAPLSLEGMEDPGFDGFDPSAAVEAAKAAEAAAYAADPRIGNTEEAAYAAARSRWALAASDGFEGSAARTRYALSVGVTAEDAGGLLQREGWFTRATLQEALDDPAAVGREAARRCVRRLGWRKVETRPVPVVLSPEVAAAFAAEVAGACCGGALVRGASFLADSLGETVASPLLTIVDDPALPRGPGSRPFDGEGVRPERRTILEKGVLRSFLFDSYALRRLRAERPARAEGGRPGNADRALGGSTAAGFSNLFVEAGPLSPEEVVAAVDDGFYVVETMGFGVNPVTGDWSKGAAGLWIRDGRLDHAVQEVTVAGNLREMLRGVEAVGNDLVHRDRCAAPTLRIARMTVSGS
jgi:PmbA protein